MASLAKVIIGKTHDFEGCVSLFTFKVVLLSFRDRLHRALGNMTFLENICTFLMYLN